MLLLLDTHILLWAAYEPHKLGTSTRERLKDPSNVLIFSAASMWEIAIKSGLGRKDFAVDPGVLRRGLLENDYRELEISGSHATAVSGLPPVHQDPFDRILVAQAKTEGITLLTADSKVAAYGSPVQLI